MTRGFDARASLPLGRLGKPEELAWPVAFLCTPAAAYSSGAVMDVNGGTFVGQPDSLPTHRHRALN